MKKMPYKWVKRILIADAAMLIVACAFVFTTAKPAPIKDFTIADSTYGTASLAWDKDEYAKAYRIYRSTDKKNYEYIATTSDNEYTDKNLRTGTTYYYRISARNGFSQNGTEDNKAAEVTPKLNKPKVKLDTSKGEIKLKIADVDGAIGYEIIRDGKKLDQIEDTTYVDADAEVDKEHTYEVRAVRYKKEPVFSEPSDEKEAELHSVPDLEIKVRDDDLHLDWNSSDYYDNYKVYNGDELLTETDSTEYTLEDFKMDTTYNIKLIGYSEDESSQSPDSGRRFKVVEEDMDTEGARQAAVDWGLDIAADDSFTYGSGMRAHRCGCYFCGTNVRKKGKGYEKTYCCNPFVHACYAHGAGDPQMLKTCQKGGSVGMNAGDYTRYGNWSIVGKPSIANLQVGDVLVRNDHVMLYIGDGEIVHAAVEGWSAKSISVGNASSFYGKVKFVARYNGTGSGTMLSIKDVDENGNIIEDKDKDEEGSSDEDE